MELFPKYLLIQCRATGVVSNSVDVLCIRQDDVSSQFLSNHYFEGFFVS